ncbi:recombinase family protein [Salisediminibacterium selenitireducens]|uniref:Resolvase domain protein n=1 Tax=Bacillus selenitireducens (strain ATCC 700615 / DSM 15326 / MLS10) TaxID=439292 RepID=D6XZG2_BACIE|nr:recombinase family protein [Salisediminibacterium selenitireducens]ADH98336.1 Resolvase domain protein [[Bacillus] selenitireducens MLS10]
MDTLSVEKRVQRMDPLVPDTPKEPAKIRTAAYIRVSSLSDEQEGSLDNQKQHYTQLIRSNPEWRMVDLFIDQGKSGTSTVKRPAFNRMMRMARDGELDLILCKSVSRFARNVTDTIDAIRAFKELGVRLVFDKEGIDTADMTSEFILTLLAATAQEESRSTSDNITWAIKRQFEQGKAPYRRKLGYRKGEDGNWEVIEHEARLVRLAYEQAAKGYTAAQIARQFIMRKFKKINGRTDWSATTIRLILRNRDYTGDVICQKYYVDSYLTHQRKVNRGEREKIVLRGHHEPIIEKELFDTVQAVLDKRKKPNERREIVRYPLSSRMTCHCGGTLHRYECRNKVRWRCENQIKSKALCKQTSIEESLIKKVMKEAMMARFRSEKGTYPLGKMAKELSRAISARDVEYNQLRLNLERALLDESLVLFDTDLIGKPNYQEQLDERKQMREEIEQKLKQKEVWRSYLEADHVYREQAINVLETLKGMMEPNDRFYEHWNHTAFLRAWVTRIEILSPMSFRIVWFDGINTEIDLQNGVKWNE